jgi:MarR family transcriptional regulator, lower aerobic nicotinate degradation pathway regulator
LQALFEIITALLTSDTVKSLQTKPMEITALPGHNIRRLQQIAVAIYTEHTRAHGITPVQFAALKAILAAPGLDQRTLAATIQFDTSTIGGVIDRLEARGLVVRGPSATDRRVHLLTLTPSGEAALFNMLEDVMQAQKAILAPLNLSEQSQFTALLEKILRAHADKPTEKSNAQ